MRQGKRIYVVIPTWGLQQGIFDTNNFFINQARALKRAGYDPIVLSVRLLPIKTIRSLKLCRINNEYIIDGVKICIYDLYVPFPVALNKIRDKYISFFYHKILKSFLKIDKFNKDHIDPIIHAHVSHECGYYCLDMSKKEQIPIVVTEHYSGLLTGVASQNDYARVKETIESSDSFIFVGSHFKERVCEMLGIKKQVYVIPNMINSDRYNICDEKNETFCFLTAGTLKKNKRMDLVIQAFSNEFKKEENVRLLIAGEGVDRKRLEDLTDKLKENERISFFGEYQIDDAGPLFSHSDAFVLTSEFETFGIVYVEALFCGLPCIGTKGQGGDDIITDKNGFLVNHGDIPELQAAMRHLYENIESYDKHELRKDAVTRFSEENVSQLLTEIYKKSEKGEHRNA